MFHKRPRTFTSEDIPAPKRLREHLADLFLSNEVSAARVQSLAADGHAAGASSMDLRSAGKSGAIPGNISRDLRRKLLRRSPWQRLYYVKVQVFDVKKQAIVRKVAAFALPHEIMHVLVLHSGKAPFLNTAGMCAKTLSNIQGIKAELQVQELCGLGLWGDGIPVSWDRSQSVDTWTMSIPGLATGNAAAARFPICAPQPQACGQVCDQRRPTATSGMVHQAPSGRNNAMQKA